MSFRKDKSRRPISRRGFALIELLVVVAIVGLLAAILVPVLKHARMRSRLVCVHSDLRQITTALDSYAMNHQNKLPPTRFACGTNVNYQLPVELATTRYLPVDVFPEYDFSKGLGGGPHARGGTWTIGAFGHGRKAAE